MAKLVSIPAPYKLSNLLSEEQQKMSGPTTVSAVSGWVAGANCSLDRSTVYQKFDPSSLGVVVTNVGTAYLYTEGFVPVVAGDKYRGFAWIRTAAASREIRLGIEWLNAASESSWVDGAENSATMEEVVKTISVTDGWVLFSVTMDVPSGASFMATKARLRIVLPDAGTPEATPPYAAHQQIWVDDACIILESKKPSPFQQMVRQWIPEYLLLLDAEQTDPISPMSKYIDLIAGTASRILATCVSFDYIPDEGELSGFRRSTLVSPALYTIPDAAEPRWLPWLAFVTGTSLFRSTVSLVGLRTPWYILEESFTNWSAISALTWDALEEYDVTPPEGATSLSESIRTRGSGVLAGTSEGIKRTARIVLGGVNVFDAPAEITRVNNVATVKFDLPVELSDGWPLDVYDSGVSSLDDVYDTYTVVSSTVVTFASVGEDLLVPVSAYLTNKVVEIVKGDPTIWDITVNTLAVQSPPVEVVESSCTLAKPAGCLITNVQL